MTVSTSQRQLFDCVFNRLIAYANTKLGTISYEEGRFDHADDKLRVGLIARALWQHLDVISDYVRENPDHLAGTELKVARDLHDVIYDDFVFEGSVDEPVLVHRTGSYRVTCLDDHWGQGLPDQPVILRTALVPFMDSILLVCPCDVIGLASEGYCDELRREATRRGSYVTTSSGPKLAERARAWQRKQQKRREEIRRPQRGPGEGYHRGCLAGLSGLERKRAKETRYDLVATESGLHQHLMEQRSVEADVFPLSLKEGLDLLDGDWLISIAQHVANLPEPPEMPRADLITLICNSTIHNEGLLNLSLMWCEQAQFDLLVELMRTNPLSLVHMTPTQAERLFPMVPYVFILREGNCCVAWMPPEIHTLVTKADLAQVAEARNRLSKLSYGARALASMCGIVSLDDAYERYRAVDTTHLDRRQFEVALIELEDCDTRDSYALWEHEGITYLVSGSLADEGALARVVRASYADRVINLPEGSKPDGIGVLAIDDQDVEDIYQRLEDEQAWLQRQRVRLLAAKSSLPVHDLDANMLHESFVDYLLETEPLLRVRSYVDEHMPDSEDDYEFPDTFCRALIISQLFENESYDEMLDVIRLFGMSDCEGKTYPHTLGKLVTDVFNNLPSWVLNGWSLSENTERISGRPMPLQADK